MDTSNKQVMKVFAARDYDAKRPRLTKYVEVNVPEIVPTLAQDGNVAYIGLSASYFANTNYPITTGRLQSSHFISLPLLGGSDCPNIFPKGTEFLLFMPTYIVEDGYLMYIK